MSKPFYPVFNLLDQPFMYVDGDAMHQFKARSWRILPYETAMRLVDNPDLFIDFGAGSFSDASLPYCERHTRAIHFAGVLDVVTGYGNATHPILTELNKRSDINLSLSRTGFWHKDLLPIEIQKLMESAEAEKPPFFPDQGEWTFRNPAPKPPPRPLPARWSIALTVPPELPIVPTPRKLLYTMAEGDAIPVGSGIGKEWQDDKNDWVSHIYAYADILAVPCQEMKEVFEKSGAGKEARVVPLGCSFDVFQYVERQRERLALFAPAHSPRKEKRDIFTIVVDGHLAPRKAPTLSLLEVVYPVLDKEEDWRLVIKCRAGESGMLGGIRDDRVIVVASDFTPEQMAALYQHADVGLCLSLYEGWGMTFREMMAVGLPVIVSATSGHKEDCDPEYNHPVPIKAKEQINDYFNLTAYRDIPDWEAARNALRFEYEGWKATHGAQSVMGAKAAEWIRRRRKWRTTTNMLLDLIAEADEHNMRRNGKHP